MQPDLELQHPRRRGIDRLMSVPSRAVKGSGHGR
jgi:hypothetical protein